MATLPHGTGNAAAFFCWMAAASTFAIPAPLATAENVGDNTIPAFSFPWLSPSNDPSGTRILPAGPNVWRRDNTRETRKELNYWAAIRKAEIERLSVIYRAETQQALNAARAKADAFRAFASAENKARQKRPDGNHPTTRTINGRTAGKSPLAKLTTATVAQMRNAQETVQNATERLAKAIDGSFAPGRPANRTPSSSAVVLALLSIFMLPAIAGVLLITAFLNLRSGYRLRGAAFALLGLSLSALIYAAAFQRQSLAGSGRELFRQAFGN